MKPTVFVPEPIAQAGIELLLERTDCITPWRGAAKLNIEEAAAVLRASDAVIVRLFVVSRDDLAYCPKLKVIAKHGAGVDNIAVQAAREKGIQVVYTPEANSNAVAEHAVALMMALARKIASAAPAAKEGNFKERYKFEGIELAGKTCGVLGVGRIGRRVAQIAGLGLGMRVVAYDPFVKEPPVDVPVELQATALDVLKQSDFVSLHVPLTPDTHHMLNEEILSQLKPGCRIINTSRGAIIDEMALVRALHEEVIAGAALDVFEEEPLPASHPLCHAPNILLTPHISSSTKESLDRMAVHAAQGVLDVLEGRTPQYPYPGGGR